MPRRIEMNPGEMFLVGDNVLLVREYESVLGDVSKFDGGNRRIAYFFSFTGKLNNKDRSATYTVAVSPEDALEFVNMVLNGLEMLTGVTREVTGEDEGNG